MSKGNRKLRNDIILISAILMTVIIAATLMFITRSEGDTVSISVDGELWGEYSLREDRTVEIKNGDGYNILIIENGKAYVKSASCPDGICSSHRPIENDGESIICLPNKVVIEINTVKKDEADIIM